MAAPEAVSGKSPSARRKILIVEDEPFIRKVVSRRLEANGYDVIQANDGVEGIEKARNENPQLIILDVFMPRKDGIAVRSELRSDPRTSDIPFLFLTVLPPQELFRRGGLSRTDEVVMKPFNATHLLEKIRGLLS